MVRLLLYLLFVPQGDLPYLDALPLDQADRGAVIDKWVGQARFIKRECCTYPEYREATRLYLFYLLDERGSDEAWYVLGRLQGRHHLWTVYWTREGLPCTGWIDLVKD